MLHIVPNAIFRKKIQWFSLNSKKNQTYTTSLNRTCLIWGANFHINKNQWKYQSFRGTKWMNINQEVSREYLKNTYRVLLTRARQGMVIFIPKGSNIDHTRPIEFYDGTYKYFKEIGIEELS